MVALVGMAAFSTTGLLFDLISIKAKFKSYTLAGWIVSLLIGFVTDFFDTLGIGSFALSTALFRFTKSCDDREIPGSLNIGHAIPVVVEALLFLQIVRVEAVTLFAMVFAAALGACLGAGIVSKMPVNQIRLGMGVALFIVVGIMFLQITGIFPSGGDAIALKGPRLLIAVVCNFILGALMTIGVGLYAPCMALVYALGMSPAVAFPIMMGSCALLMPVASIRFIKAGVYDVKSTLSLTLGGVVGVFMAAGLFSRLNLRTIKILVMVVIVYTAGTMLRDGIKRPSPKAFPASARPRGKRS
jgi:uncharacterized membrane protein YfcA